MTKPLPRLLLRSLIITVITVVILLFAAWQLGRWYFQESVFHYSGTETLQGLDAPVEILFDARGIPRVYSDTNRDAVFALGWLHAGERLFQMELIRRVAAGRLAEVLGESLVAADGVHLSLGFAERAAGAGEQLDPATRTLVRGYVDGINAYLESGRRLPPEFALMSFRPRAWTVDDVVMVMLYQTWYPHSLVARLSETYRDLVDLWGEDTGHWLAAVQSYSPASLPAVTRMTESSNTWVVAPAHSASGHALHAADPHLDIAMAPGLWYAAGLHSGEGLDVLGVTAPGLPMVAMGHNGHAAWAFTVAPVDVYQFYRQPLDADDPQRVQGPDGWETVARTEHRVPVKGRDEPALVTLESTSLGVVVQRGDDALLVMHWTGFDFPPAPIMDNALRISRARDFDTFRDAAMNMGGISINWSWSDRDGNIGYVLSTPIPKRNQDYFFAAADGTDPEQLWQGYRPIEERPWALNPEQGWLASSNNQPVDENWPYAIPGFYKFHRARRVRHWLDGEHQWTAADMVRMQNEQVSDIALAWKDALADTAQTGGGDTLARRLREWDGGMHVDSDLAALFSRWWGLLPGHLYAGVDDLRWQDLHAITDQLLLNPPAGGVPLAGIDMQTAFARALDDALAHGATDLGNMQTLTIQHPLAQSGLLNRWLDLTRGPRPLGGDAGSINVAYTRWDEQRARRAVVAGASMRFVMDWADPDAFTLNLTLGQSGHPMSPHFDDFLDDFVSGTPWPVPYTREAAETRARQRLRLTPGR